MFFVRVKIYLLILVKIFAELANIYFICAKIAKANIHYGQKK